MNSAGAAGQVGGTDPSLRDGDRDGDGEAQGRRPKRGASERARERMQRLQGASDGEGDSDEQGTPGPDTCGKRPRRGGASAVLSRDAALGSRGEAGREVGERKQRRRRAEGPVGAPGRERKKGREAPAERGRKEEFFLSAEERRRRREEEAAREQALAELKRKEAAARARDQFQAEIGACVACICAASSAPLGSPLSCSP